MSIELRLSNVEPPNPEPKRTIYRDIVNLPDPVLLGMTVRYFNYDSVTLYFKITGSGTGYTFGNVALGSLATGTNAYVNLDEFASRAKPSAETEEDITLTLKAYTDSGYTNLKWTFERVVHVVFINSADPSYTVTEYNFDDGTMQGWTATLLVGGNLGSGVDTNYVLSPPYAASAWATDGTIEFYLSRVITTPNQSVVYAVINVFLWTNTVPIMYYRSIKILNGDTVLIQLGIDISATADAIPSYKWMRIVVPLPPNTSVTLKVQALFRGSAAGRRGLLNIDDVRIVSK